MCIIDRVRERSNAARFHERSNAARFHECSNAARFHKRLNAARFHDRSNAAMSMFHECSFRTHHEMATLRTAIKNSLKAGETIYLE